MRTRARHVRWSVSTWVIATLVGFGGDARAEDDAFGLGDGHDGAKVVAADPSGEVVNTYAALTADVAAGGAELTIGAAIGAPRPFVAGDLVLVWRATGVAPQEAPSGNQTKRLNLAASLATTSRGAQPGLVGQYELARLASVAPGGKLTLTKPLTKGFAALDSQVVRVPEYTTLTVPANRNLVAAAWQQVGAGASLTAPDPNAPWAGGIVIFLAQGTVTNSGRIHANGRGFHGAVPAPRPITLGLPLLTCNTNALDGAPAGGFAEKGEGVVQLRVGSDFGGRGNVSMAGGGANCTEGGGGGGANRGDGGQGSGTVAGLASGGLGGVGVDYDLLERMTMGGGGGAGRYIAGIFSQVSFGGFGGGVVYLRASTLSGGGRLEASGANGESSGLVGLPTPLASEGSGGGGAGGTVVVRLTGVGECGGIAGVGGNGGDAQVLGLSIFGAGGGGGGGRAFVQAASLSPVCGVDVKPGSAGNGGAGGSQPGDPGLTQPPPERGGFCFEDVGCTDPARPICDVGRGVCRGCSGPLGGGSPSACKVAWEPVCLASGQCAPCSGDLGTGASQRCQLAVAPYCHVGDGQDGACGRCTVDADCTTNASQHTGPICNVVIGACGTACAEDGDCKAAEWCAPAAADGTKVCTPKTPNGQPVPTAPPDVDGRCTAATGRRVCLSGGCEESDDRCGKRNESTCGDEPECRSNVCFAGDDKCGKPNGEPCSRNEECRVEVCFAGDDKCGKPNGEPCGRSTDCRSAICEDGECVGCRVDAECGAGRVCEKGVGACVTGCRPGASGSSADSSAPASGCPASQICVPPESGAPDATAEIIGSCEPGALGPSPSDGGLAAGLAEGGGCSCGTAPAGASPFAFVGAGLGAFAFARRRKGTRRR